MTRGFDEYEDIAAAAVTDVLGETAQITPRAAVRYGAPGVDPDRDGFQVKGVFSLAPTTARIKGQKVGADIASAAMIAVNQAEFWISGAVFEAAATEVRRGDQATIRGTAYAIGEVRPHDTGDVTLILTREDG